MQQKLSVSVMQLMEETLGLSVDVLDGTAGTSVYENVASGTVDANLEVWRGLKDRSLEEIKTSSKEWSKRLEALKEAGEDGAESDGGGDRAAGKRRSQCADARARGWWRRGRARA